jgi:hypothetical protein
MAVPPEFRGVWHRTGLLIDGERMVDTRDVVWLQSDSVFGDIRAPLTGAQASADVRLRQFEASWVMWGPQVDVDASEITWHVIRDGAPRAEPFAYRWSGAVIVESGHSVREGAEYDWEEEWVRLTEPDAPSSVLWTDEAFRVDVGEFSLQVDLHSGHGELWQRNLGSWVLRSQVG